jgi:hypothetical protein
MPIQSGLLYVLWRTNVREAQVKWAKLTVYQLLAVGYATPKAGYTSHCFIHVLSSADACWGGAVLETQDQQFSAWYLAGKSPYLDRVYKCSAWVDARCWYFDVSGMYPGHPCRDDLGK